MKSSNDTSSDADVRLKVIEALQPLLNSLVSAIDTEHTPEMVDLRNIFVRRLIFSGDVIPSRIPPPSNISEIGGYLNYLQDLNHAEMALSTVASALGLAVPLSDDEKTAMVKKNQTEPIRSFKQALEFTAAWVPVCNTKHEFWSGKVENSYSAARSSAACHDQSVHSGTVTAAVLSL